MTYSASKLLKKMKCITPLMVDLGYKDVRIKDWKIVIQAVENTIHKLCSGEKYSYNREEESDGD